MPDPTYVLVGGKFTPTRFIGTEVGTMECSDLLGIAQACPPPFISHEDVLPPDPADADVLAVRAYLASPWGQVRQYDEGLLSLFDF